MSTSTHPIIVLSDSNVEDVFSSTNTPEYTPASPDYSPAYNTLCFQVIDDVNKSAMYLLYCTCLLEVVNVRFSHGEGGSGFEEWGSSIRQCPVISRTIRIDDGDDEMDIEEDEDEIWISEALMAPSARRLEPFEMMESVATPPPHCISDDGLGFTFTEAITCYQHGLILRFAAICYIFPTSITTISMVFITTTDSFPLSTTSLLLTSTPHSPI
ncbi:hypothetical protein Tco_0705616 [Tanacetum coccineum]|uniref:Uncharacterized protein n=1 Tax=Tanacetum coccineum TaxID=301880 RepID=A0ABQ4Y725_9ASTR